MEATRKKRGTGRLSAPASRSKIDKSALTALPSTSGGGSGGGHGDLTELSRSGAYSESDASGFFVTVRHKSSVFKDAISGGTHTTTWLVDDAAV